MKQVEDWGIFFYPGEIFVDSNVPFKVCIRLFTAPRKLAAATEQCFVVKH